MVCSLRVRGNRIPRHVRMSGDDVRQGPDRDQVEWVDNRTHLFHLCISTVSTMACDESASTTNLDLCVTHERNYVVSICPPTSHAVLDIFAVLARLAEELTSAMVYLPRGLKQASIHNRPMHLLPMPNLWSQRALSRRKDKQPILTLAKPNCSLIDAPITPQHPY